MISPKEHSGKSVKSSRSKCWNVTTTCASMDSDISCWWLTQGINKPLGKLWYRHAAGWGNWCRLREWLKVWGSDGVHCHGNLVCRNGELLGEGSWTSFSKDQFHLKVWMRPANLSIFTGKFQTTAKITITVFDIIMSQNYLFNYLLWLCR